MFYILLDFILGERSSFDRFIVWGHNFLLDFAVNRSKIHFILGNFDATCAGGSVPRTPIWGLYLVCHDSICATPMSSQNETQASSKNDWSQA